MSTLFTHDAKFVLSGSDDGNVRIWKAKAHEKLGIIDSRERAAIEYRESLKQKWKADAQVSKVARYVISSFYHCIIFALGERKSAYSFADVVTCSLIEGPGTCQNPYTRRHSSRERCWMHRESRRNEEGNILGRESRNRKRRRGQLLSQNRHSRIFSMFDIFYVFHTYSRFLSHIFRIEYPSFILSRPSSPSVYYRHNYLSAAYHTPHLILILPSFCPSHRHNWPIIPASQIPNPTSGDKPPLNFI